MIDIFLQDAIKTKLEDIFKNFAVGRNGGKQIAVYRQELPLLTGGEDEEALFPYIIVRLLEGGKEDETAPHTVRVILVVGIYDDNSDRQGHHDLLNVMHKVEMGLFKTRVLEGKYELVFPFKWVLQDKSLWPFFYGAMETNWNIAFIEREDDLFWQDQA